MKCLLLFFPSIALAQWMELDKTGKPSSGQWQEAFIKTPSALLKGYKTQTQLQDPHYFVVWFEPTRKVVEVNFIVKTPSENQRGLTFGLSFGNPTHWSQQTIKLAFGGNGFLLRQDIGDWFVWGSKFSWLPVLSFPYNNWLQVRIVADPTIGSFRLWLTDMETGERQTTESLPFLNPTPQLNCLFLFNGEGDGANIEVSQPQLDIHFFPNAPKSLQVIPTSSGHLRLTWKPSEGTDIRSYRIYRRKQFIVELPSTITTWEDDTVQTGEAYSYCVSAVNSFGESLPSWSDAGMPSIDPVNIKLSVSGHPSLSSRYDIVVIGATPAGISASITCARFGYRVALVEPTDCIGGMMTNGLSSTDRRYRQASGGLFSEFLERVERFYKQAYGENSYPHRACKNGYLFEPKVALQIFWQMISEVPNLRVYLKQSLTGVLKEGNYIKAVLLHDENRGLRWRMEGEIFIDATYEGDLAYLAGAEYRIGREGRFEFGEKHAGEVFWDTDTKQINFGNSNGDKKVQAYNYRLNLTNRPDNRYLIPSPISYEPERYTEIAQRVQEGVLWHPLEVFSLVKLPRLKFDANNMPGPFPSTDYIGGSYNYPEAKLWQREQICRNHRDYIWGLIYFLQTDNRLPNWFRTLAQYWSFSSDEFTDNGHFPRQLYIREARRIIGDYIFTQNDAMVIEEGHRAPIHQDSIAVAEYPIDSHTCSPRNLSQPYLHEGFFYLPQITSPSHIPYRIMLPNAKGTDGKTTKIEKLLVCVAVSATHVGFGTLRLEPVWMTLGQAAGTAAHLALKYKVSLRKVPIDELQRLLLEQKQVISLFTDLPPPDTPEFASVQFFAVRGFFDTYEVLADEFLREADVKKALHQFAELLDIYPSFSFGTTDDYPTQSDIARWLAMLFSLSVSDVIQRCDMQSDFRPNEPIKRGKFFVWLYRLYWLYRISNFRVSEGKLQ